MYVMKSKKVVKILFRIMIITLTLLIIVVIRYPFSFRKLQNMSGSDFSNKYDKPLELVDCKETASKSSINFLLTDGTACYVVTAIRFPIGDCYDLSPLMLLSPETRYEYKDFFTSVDVTQSKNALQIKEKKCISPYIFVAIFSCVFFISSAFWNEKHSNV